MYYSSDFRSADNYISCFINRFMSCCEYQRTTEKTSSQIQNKNNLL